MKRHIAKCKSFSSPSRGRPTAAMESLSYHLQSHSHDLICNSAGLADGTRGYSLLAQWIPTLASCGFDLARCPMCSQGYSKLANMSIAQCDAMRCPQCDYFFCFFCSTLITGPEYFSKGHGPHFAPLPPSFWSKMSSISSTTVDGWCRRRSSNSSTVDQTKRAQAERTVRSLSADSIEILASSAAACEALAILDDHSSSDLRSPSALNSPSSIQSLSPTQLSPVLEFIPPTDTRALAKKFSMAPSTPWRRMKHTESILPSCRSRVHLGHNLLLPPQRG